MISEPQILANVLDNSRSLTNFLIQQTKELDYKKRFQVNGFHTNSIHWVIAHLAWAEDFLVLRGVGNSGTGIEWLEHVKIGASHPKEKLFAPISETLKSFNEIHQQTLKLIAAINPEQLDEPNHVGLKLNASDTKRAIIQHSIRHEGYHCGNLGWLIKMHTTK